MSKRLVLLLLPLVVAHSAEAKRDSAEEAYQQARGAYYSLKADAARRKLRHHWLNVAHKFEGVASGFPKSDRAPDALFTAAELLNELSRISRIDEDLKGATSDYLRLLEHHPKHRLADDAALSLARIYLERMEQPENARRVVEEALSRSRRGDQAAGLTALLASLPSVKSPARAAASKAAKTLPVQEGASERTGEKPTASPAARASTAMAEDGARGERAALASRPSASSGEGGGGTSVEESGPVRGAERATAAEGRRASSGPSPSDEDGPRDPVSGAAKSALAEAISRTSREPAAPRLPSTVAAVSPRASAEWPSQPPATVPPSIPLRASAEGAPSAQSRGGAAAGAAEPTRAPTSAALLASSDPAARARLQAAAKRVSHSELTLAEQLGLKVRRVVIDPGHGGHDVGATGKGGTREKDISLAIAQRLALELRERGLEVILTRDTDKYIRLEDRARYANEARGDLFISVHCNSAAQRSLRGVETYTLNTSADRYSIRLAARENASSEKGISDLQFILADLATKANTEESTRLATQVQKNLVSHLSGQYKNVRNLGTKEALFYVLLGAKMPAILVETSFLSNAEEEARLASPQYQREVARSIALGVEEFLGIRHQVAKVD